MVGGGRVEGVARLAEHRLPHERRAEDAIKVPRVVLLCTEGGGQKIVEVVNGVVRVKLFKGTVSVVGRKSDMSLYDESVVTFEEDDVYDQRDAEGFIKLNALRLRLGKRLKG